jgi:PD-(D/E)XK nuclease superfamily
VVAYASKRRIPPMKTLDVIQPHPTWNVVDPSKLTEYMRCPRKYFYRYVLGWASEYPNNHLIFGSSWHLGAEHLLRNGYTTGTLYEASRLFLAHYRKHFDESTDGLFIPKDPTTALQALADYAHKFQRDSVEYDTLHTEIGGVVSVSPEHTLYFKIDAILKDRETGKVLFLDHKTSQRKFYDWGEHWIMSTQMLTYTHVLNCLYPQAEIEGGKVRCTFFYKAKDAEFDEATISKTPNQMNAWLSRVRSWMGELDQNMVGLLEEDSPSKDVMESFPMNDTSCFSFGQKCTYFDLCNSWSNPLQHSQDPPIGMKQEHWDPRDNEVIREKVDLT